MRIRPRKLYARIYLYFLGVILVVGLAALAVFATGWRKAVVREAALRLAEHAAGVIADDFGDPRARRRAVRRFYKDLDIDVTVRGVMGDPVEVAGAPLPPLRPKQLRGALRAARVMKANRYWGWYVAAPIIQPSNGETVGVLQLSFTRHGRTPSMERPLMLAVLTLFIVGLATVPLAWRISRPVEKIAEANRRFGQGDLGYRIPLRSRRRRGRKGPDGGPECEIPEHHDELTGLMASWNDMAERVQRLVSGQKELLANVSHELRSPLARMRMALELLPRDPSDPKFQESEVRLAEVEADIGELDRLIDDVLTASRLEATGLPRHIESVEVRGICQQLVDRAAHDPLLAGKSVSLVPGEERVVEADGALLKRALWNLVENAAKYGAPPIKLEVTSTADELLLSVTDEGEGIAGPDRERVLEPFFRADTAHTPAAAPRNGAASNGKVPNGEGPVGGFGLGLTLARRIAEVHGGKITLGPLYTTEDGTELGCRITLAIPTHAKS